jgi:hypothetical protein
MHNKVYDGSKTKMTYKLEQRVPRKSRGQLIITYIAPLLKYPNQEIPPGLL